MNLMKTRLALVFLLVTFTGCINFGTSKDIKHQIKKRSDGGYTLILTGSVRHLIPITAEGPFPKEEISYEIELKGSGKDWEFRNQPGFFYSYPENIECKTPHWDMGYAWIDKNRKTINLNLYWVMSPDSLEAALVNGHYSID